MHNGFGPASRTERTVWGAARPGRDEQPRVTDDVGHWIQFMKRNDIKHVCCLLTDNELNEFGNFIGDYERAFDRVLQAPIEDHNIAEDAVLDEVLAFLREAKESEERVVVHCNAGNGRTGLVLVSWLIQYHGYQPTDAIKTVATLGRKPVDAVNTGNASYQDIIDLITA